MSIDLEDQLRQAYGELPEASSDPTEVVARSRRSAARSRRRRMTGVCAGTVAAALAVGTVAIVPRIVGTEGGTALSPAAGNTKTDAAHDSQSATAPPTSHWAIPTPPKNSKQPYPTEGSDKPLAGLSGLLLPHGSQLPAGTKYHGISTEDYKKTWTSSLEDGYANAVPVQVLTGAEQELDGPSPAQTNSVYGILSGVTDMAATSEADTSPTFRSVTSAIVRFRTPAYAQSAIAKTQRKEGGLYWVKPAMTKPNVSWSGVPGFSGAHGVYNCAGWGPGPLYVAYQVVGSYIVSAQSQTAATAEHAVRDTVGNLKTAGLLK